MLHDTVATRARQSGARALLLTGSTARGTRTPISDLDYHLVGEPITTDDLSDELDLHVVSATLLSTGF
jgi:predicted nucleotidyltransferase